MDSEPAFIWTRVAEFPKTPGKWTVCVLMFVVIYSFHDSSSLDGNQGSAVPLTRLLDFEIQQVGQRSLGCKMRDVFPFAAAGVCKTLIPDSITLKH